MDEVIEIGGERYERVKTQRAAIDVYRGARSYLRLGERPAIERALACHREMERYDYPIPRLLSEGTFGEQRYFIEESLGEETFRAIFARDYGAQKSITEAHFDSFLAIVERFAAAQVRAGKPRNERAFGRGIHVHTLCEELPAYREAIEKRFQEALNRLATLPYVLSHGDFNPSNITPSGVIDIEDAFVAPFGFDIASALMTIDWFPDGEEYEYRAQHRFSDAQRRAYLERFDALFRADGYPPLSASFDDLSYCRATWLTVRMQPWPKIQRFRYDLFIEKYL